MTKELGIIVKGKTEMLQVHQKKVEVLKATNNHSQIEENFVNARMQRIYWEDKPCTEYAHVLKYKTPPFDLIEKYYNSDKSKQIIEYIILSEFASLGFESMDRMLLSSHIMTPWDKVTKVGGFPGMTIQDFRLMMVMGIKGQFGKSYGKFVLSNVTCKDGWVDQYWVYKDLMDKEIQKKRKEKDNMPLIKKSPDDVPIPKKFIQARKDKEAKELRKKAEERFKVRKLKPISFSSIYAYCLYKEYNYERFLSFFREEWTRGAMKSTVSPDIYIKEKKKAVLFLINKKWNERNSR